MADICLYFPTWGSYENGSFFFRRALFCIALSGKYTIKTIRIEKFTTLSLTVSYVQNSVILYLC